MVSILIIDDNEEFSRKIIKLMKRNGHSVVATLNARVALEKLLSGSFEVALIDTSENVLVRGGSTIVEVLQTDYSSITRIGCTGQGDMKRMPEAKDYHFMLYKPFGLKELYQACGIE